MQKSVPALSGQRSQFFAQKLQRGRGPEPVFRCLQFCFRNKVRKTGRFFVSFYIFYIREKIPATSSSSYLYTLYDEQAWLSVSIPFTALSKEVVKMLVLGVNRWLQSKINFQQFLATVHPLHFWPRTLWIIIKKMKSESNLWIQKRKCQLQCSIILK